MACRTLWPGQFYLYAAQLRPYLHLFHSGTPSSTAYQVIIIEEDRRKSWAALPEKNLTAEQAGLREQVLSLWR